MCNAFSSFNDFHLAHRHLFISIYCTLSRSTASKFSGHMRLFNLIDHRSANGKFIANGCHSGLIYEISKWHIQSKDRSTVEKNHESLLFRNGLQIKRFVMEFKSMSKWVITVSETKTWQVDRIFSLSLSVRSVLYSLVIMMAFLINPFLFFYYDEKHGQEEQNMGKVRCYS